MPRIEAGLRLASKDVAPSQCRSHVDFLRRPAADLGDLSRETAPDVARRRRALSPACFVDSRVFSLRAGRCEQQASPLADAARPAA